MYWKSAVVEYCTEEVYRQGHDVNALDGIQRVGWLLDAWSYALENAGKITASGLIPGDVVSIGRRVERVVNNNGYRTCGIRVGSTVVTTAPQDVPDKIARLCTLSLVVAPLDFYRAYEEIHPFRDGNGRSGKVLLNLLSGRLLDPEFPPSDFWGRVIANP